MAERNLYGNELEPEFPFDVVKGVFVLNNSLTSGELSWLPPYLDESIADPAEDLNPLLNTVLVFARARTATLQNMTSWEKVHKLANKLNKVVEAVGASHHKIELVRRGPKTYFVTCTNSPRFIWSVFLTHFDVGRNLDYFAPGHMPTDPPSAQCSVYFVEKNSFEEMAGERVFVEYVKDDIKSNFLRYNSRREALFNSTMQKLSLRYRFKCLVIWPETLETVPSVMARSSPPTAEWWDDHCYFVNFCLSGVLLQPELAFCDWNTRYTFYWPLIQETFQFMMKYKRYDYWHTSEKTGAEFWTSMEKIFREIKSVCEGHLDPNTIEFQEFLARTREQFGSLAATADQSSRTTANKPSVPNAPRTHPIAPIASRFVYKLLLLTEAASLHIFHRGRLAPRLSSKGIGHPASGDQDAFQWFKY